MEKSNENITVKTATANSEEKNSEPIPYRPTPNYDVYNTDGVVIGRDC